MTESMLTVLIAFFIVTISPGPANIALATVSMQHGRQKGMRFGLGLALGLALWGVVAATGLGVVLQTSAIALTVLKVFGAVYLLWLAYQSAKSATQATTAGKNATDNGKWFYRGLLLNLSNPKAVVAWMAALSMGLGADNNLMQLIALTVCCMALGILNYLGHAFAFSITGVMATYRAFRRWIDGVVAGLFALAGFGLLRSGLSR